MALLTNFKNPRKKFNFSIVIIPGAINAFQFQKVSVSDAEIQKDAHGDTNHDIYTAGRVSFSNMVCEKLLSTSEGDKYLWDWFSACQSALIGGGLAPDSYKKTVTVFEYAENGVTVLNRWLAQGVWPCVLKGMEFDRQSSENSIEHVEFSVDVLSKI